MLLAGRPEYQLQQFGENSIGYVIPFLGMIGLTAILSYGAITP